MPQDNAAKALAEMLDAIHLLKEPGPLSGLPEHSAILRQNAHSFEFFEVDRVHLRKAITHLSAKVRLASHGVEALRPDDYLLLTLLLNMAGHTPEDFVQKETHATH